MRRGSSTGVRPVDPSAAATSSAMTTTRKVRSSTGGTPSPSRRRPPNPIPNAPPHPSDPPPWRREIAPPRRDNKTAPLRLPRAEGHWRHFWTTTASSRRKTPAPDYQQIMLPVYPHSGRAISAYVIPVRNPRATPATAARRDLPSALPVARRAADIGHPGEHQGRATLPDERTCVEATAAPRSSCRRATPPLPDQGCKRPERVRRRRAVGVRSAGRAYWSRRTRDARP